MTRLLPTLCCALTLLLLVACQMPTGAPYAYASEDSVVSTAAVAPTAAREAEAPRDRSVQQPLTERAEPVADPAAEPDAEPAASPIGRRSSTPRSWGCG